MTRMTLNGNDWLFKDYYGEDWRWRNAAMPDTRDVRYWRTGSVPGSVQHDVWQAGEIPDPYFERNGLLAEWVPQRTWLYKKTFAVDAGLRGRRVRLCFEGVDYEAEFFLNGASLGSHRGMYTPVSFDVTDRLNYGGAANSGDNLLVVVIQAAPQEEPQIGRTSRVRTHKARMNYWWDFAPRFVHQGIWDDVYLDVTGPVWIADVWVRPQLSDDMQAASVQVQVSLDCGSSTSAAATAEAELRRSRIKVLIRLDGLVIAEAERTEPLAEGHNTITFDFDIAHPRLWWPNGYGEQPLYECEVTVQGEGDAEASDTRRVTFGIRKIEFLPNDTPDASARPYTLTVNGRKIYINGWNWVPIDVLYGVPRPAKLERLLRLAQQANVNLLRIWGGGLIEKEAFYHLCDRLGILVWQEFIMSSSGIDNVPSEDPDFIAMIVTEAEQIVPRKRNHPSLAVWCGGNELHVNPGQRPLDESTSLVLAALKGVVDWLDSGRCWLPTSPSGKVFGNSLQNIAADPLSLHDVHGPWEYRGVTDQYTLYNQGASLLHSEFGVEGLTNRRTLDAVIAPRHQRPVSLENPLWQHLAAWWVRRPTWDETFGRLTRVADLLAATQFTQAEGLRYALEADRRRTWRNSGTLPWQFNEPYPMAACTSAVDYYARPKPAYYAVARAYAPLTVTASFPTLAWKGRGVFAAELFASHSGLDAMPGVTWHARLIGLSGRVYAQTGASAHIAANTTTRLASVGWLLADVREPGFLLDLSLLDPAGGTLAAARYVFSTGANLRPLLNVPATTLHVQAAPSAEGETVTVRNTGGYAALNVWLEDARPVTATGYAYFDDDYFTLLPGETRAVRVTWAAVPAEQRCIEVRAWNASWAEEPAEALSHVGATEEA
jgi:beta-mannosidase